MLAHGNCSQPASALVTCRQTTRALSGKLKRHRAGQSPDCPCDERRLSLKRGRAALVVASVLMATL